MSSPRAPSRAPWGATVKRAIDVLGSLAALALLSPVFAAVAWRIRRDSPGPVFFRQTRAGRGGRLFSVWKFRTMTDGAASAGLGLNVAEGDPRITKVGAFLREWSLDELPQIINVLTGEMSLIGPRPALPEQAERYTSAQRRAAPRAARDHGLGAGQRAQRADVGRADRARHRGTWTASRSRSTCASWRGRWAS